MVITGAASGIGRELARQCAAQGAHLALNDWNAKALEAISRELVGQGVRVFHQSYDASEREEAALFLQEVLSRFGQVDILINNAGVAMLSQEARQADPKAMEEIFRVNIWSVVHHAQLFLPQLENSGGMLVNISSLFGLIGYAYQAPYVMTKFAVRGFTETLRQEYAGSAVTISCVHPGGVKTDLIRNIRGENGAFRDKLAKQFERVARTTPEQAAAKIIRGIRKRKLRILVGPDARLFDFLARLFPARYQRFLPRAFDPQRFRQAETVSSTALGDD